MKLKLKALILAVAMCAAALTATGCGRLEEIDPFDEQYISYQFSGVSGYTGEFMLDPRSAPLVLTTSYRSDYDKPLSNGDVVKLTVIPTEKELKEAGYKLSRSEAEVVVEGLEEIPNELPEDAANTIIGDLQEYVFKECEKQLYAVGDAYGREMVVKTVREPELVRGLYEVTTQRAAEESPFANDEDTADKSFSYLDEPVASFKALWMVSYTLEYTQDSMFTPNKAGDIIESKDYFYGEISRFTMLDGKVHYTEPLNPLASNSDYDALNDKFDSLSDKEHLAKVEY